MNKKSLASKKRYLSGPKGIYSAVVAQATQDALYGEPEDKRSALRYLRSDYYRTHLQVLGVPDTWLPEPD